MPSHTDRDDSAGHTQDVSRALSVDGHCCCGYALEGQLEAVSDQEGKPIAGYVLHAYTALGPLPNGPLGTPQDSDITRLVWDKAGNYITLRSGGPGWKQPVVQSIRFDAFGNPTESGSGEDLDGNQRFMVRRKQSFDALGRLQWSADALGILSQNRFDSESHLLGTGRYSNAMAQVQNYAYDARGQLISVSDNQGQGYHIRYSAQGLPTQVIDALGRDVLAGTTSHSLHSRQLKDDFGRSVATISPDSGTTTRDFDAADRLVESTDAKGNQARYGYDPRGRVQQQTIRDASTAQAQTTTWEYLGSRLIALHHPLQSERYGYDARGLRTEKITTLTMPQGRFTRVTGYQYDDRGVLQSSSLPDGSQVVYTRNGQGQVVGVVREHIRTPWLRWTAPAQVIAKDLQRDIMGLKHYTTGNGIEAEFQRSRDGALARVLYRQTREPALQTAGSHLPALLGQTTQEFIDLLLGIRPAQAAPASANSDKPSPLDAAPGALGLAPDPRAFLDHRYLWDVRGNLLHMQSRNKQAVLQQNYAYDGQDRLLVAASTRSTSRYFYDAAGRRVLSQQDVADPTDFKTNTLKTRFEPNTHRRAGTNSIQSRLDANGQPQSIGQRDYVWDALGKLTAVGEQDRTLANYRYNHRGERIAKTVGTQSWSFLYDNQQLVGELNAQGQLIREYVYLADQPVAVIDTPEGQSPRKPDASAITDIVHDLQTIGSVWFGSTPMVWLHTNHLGAPEAATDASGKLVWQARYAPFGQAAINSPGFSLNLRLPGQYEDAETGLYYNRQRYYDPQAGQYLTPDPLGTPSGSNGYAYVRYNPLKYVDPDGLILFAFDGTGNTNDESLLTAEGGSLSNVWKFFQAYEDGDRRYVSGVGTLYQDSQYGNIQNPWYKGGDTTDMGLNLTGPARIERMLQYFNDEALATTDHNTAMEVDIVGFSRGAAEARDFANQLVSLTHNGLYRNQTTTGGKQVNICQKMDFRFMGLWDTVLSTNASRPYQLAIPSAFSYVAQAVALNEYRGDSIHPYGSIGAFPLESIMDGMYSTAFVPGSTRIERGFIGAHADIGGGFAANENQLAQVALAWMVQQARDAGVSMNNLPLTVPPNPVIHDKSDSIRVGAPSANAEDRAIRYGGDSLTTQRDMPFAAGMSYWDSQRAVGSNGEKIINYLASNDPSRYRSAQEGQNFVTGTVNMKAYLEWLRNNGYELGTLQVQ